jgi:hypothetical protein
MAKNLAYPALRTELVNEFGTIGVVCAIDKANELVSLRFSNGKRARITQYAAEHYWAVAS